jgi:hypothetical protein
MKLPTHHRDVGIPIHPESVFNVTSVFFGGMSHTPKVTNFFPFAKSSTLVIFLRRNEERLIERTDLILHCVQNLSDSHRLG